MLTSGLLSDLEVRVRPCFPPTFLTPQVRLVGSSSSSWSYVRTACSSSSVLCRGFIIYLRLWCVKYPLWDTETHIWGFLATEWHILTRIEWHLFLHPKLPHTVFIHRLLAHLSYNQYLLRVKQSLYYLPRELWMRITEMKLPQRIWNLHHEINKYVFIVYFYI